jgi:hypothetical protein
MTFEELHQAITTREHWIWTAPREKKFKAFREKCSKSRKFAWDRLTVSERARLVAPIGAPLRGYWQELSPEQEKHQLDLICAGLDRWMAQLSAEEKQQLKQRAPQYALNVWSSK